MHLKEWKVRYLEMAKVDIKKLGEPRASHVRKAIRKVSRSPLPFTEGGYGKPLGNKRNNNLTGLLKVKLRNDGIRIVYSLERIGKTMTIVIVGVRDDEAVYREAAKRL
ncbi:type II toxin-antitoxin system RelE/ParE family toxin [Bifidobacterium sp. ESL0775]|uniref:type II toxin-antitoxin system RelE family toxin n=1 Tax=Bifidobacterium sp. ESL0775 TaxID=2983230 RepID=UPI0023F62EAF|nr:type II toxin-antitoxin system RelE/ParE family toxin [Bifidobacterium sp. ESL0775]WEV69888.1 type II toxin-antitoxin system RelE/ParE family toxin [Bifidobacterium sp. ESL0775]